MRGRWVGGRIGGVCRISIGRMGSTKSPLLSNTRTTRLPINTKKQRTKNYRKRCMIPINYVANWRKSSRVTLIKKWNKKLVSSNLLNFKLR